EIAVPAGLAREEGDALHPGARGRRPPPLQRAEVRARVRCVRVLRPKALFGVRPARPAVQDAEGEAVARARMMGEPRGGVVEAKPHGPAIEALEDVAEVALPRRQQPRRPPRGSQWSLEGGVEAGGPEARTAGQALAAAFARSDGKDRARAVAIARGS